MRKIRTRFGFDRYIMYNIGVSYYYFAEKGNLRMINISHIVEQLQENGTLQRSRDILLQLVESNPTDQLLCRDCGHIMAMLGLKEDAISLLEKSIDENEYSKDMEDSYFKLAYLYMMTKDFDKALSVLEVGIQYFPDDYSLITLKAIVLYTLKNHSEAFTILLENLLYNSSDKKMAEHRQELTTCLSLFIKRV